MNHHVTLGSKAAYYRVKKEHLSKTILDTRDSCYSYTRLCYILFELACHIIIVFL